MSETSSDSDSSCGWTVINHEGSDVEVVNSVMPSDTIELTSESSSLGQEELLLQVDQRAEDSQSSTVLIEENAYPTLEETKSEIEAEEEKFTEDNIYFGAASDDSDIVTLEPPKLEEIGIQEVSIVEEAQNPEDFMGSSSSSHYAFCQPETGTIQIQKRQQLVRKIHENELSDMKDYLSQCQQEQDSVIDYKSLKENLARCWTHTEAEKMSFETEKKSLATENQDLRMSLEKDEEVVSLLREELRKLREQIRMLEDEGASTELVRENQKLKQNLEEEKQKLHSFLKQKETVLADAEMLKKELAKERLISAALREELQLLSARQPQGDSPRDPKETKEVAVLRERLGELEQKLNFEQQRSDLWERLYVEAKDLSGKQETDGKKKGGRGNHRAKNKSKETLLGSVKETFDAMKNSTKEFVRHHKEKIKQAKEAVKENLKKFSDSVKSTFRHFKDTTRNIFDEKGNKRFGSTKEAAAEKPRTVFSDYLHPQYKAPPPSHNSRGPSMRRDTRKEKPVHFEDFRKNTHSQKCQADHDCRENHSFRKTCSSVFECAAEESTTHPNMMVNPITMDEFRQLLERYFIQELDAFHHWKELDQFINKFFLNGIFRHDQKLFADFVSDVKDYLKDMKEYQVDNDGVFENLDGYIYRYFFGVSFPPRYGPSRPDKKQRMVNIENSRHRKQEQKHLQAQPNKREGKWHKYGRTNGRHMANLEIELGQLPFDPKY
ncbi:cell cycle progression protein 1 isoform X6 [Ochotona curzoniae]|uniref:cell cycle progression protein 1 isoform X6 n=1 Tax=Ochotona curzoniae TaxID=130825 RepID=UPI001B352B54|nr:cell cycle progression protein 1 isoform X6 [Ochotona curzoniae]